MHTRSLAIPLLLTACLTPAAAPAQDLGAVESLFEEVSAVTVFFQSGGVLWSDDVKGEWLHGAGTEVLLDLKAGDAWDLELGLGASFLRGYEEKETTLDLRTSLRAFPTITLYATPFNFGNGSVYFGASFGLVELWNAQAYDAAGQTWDVEARTFEIGGSSGLYWGPGKGIGLFAETGLRWRDFGSLKWTIPDDAALPESWRSLNFSGYYVQAGVQLRMDEKDEEDENDAITPPAPAGTWTLERVDGATLPAPLDSLQSGQNEAVHGVLRLRADEDAEDGEPDGAWTLEMNVRPAAGRAGRRVLHEEEGRYTLDENVLTLTAQDGRTYRLERLSGRLYLQWRGQVLTFAPGDAAPKEE